MEEHLYLLLLKIQTLNSFELRILIVNDKSFKKDFRMTSKLLQKNLNNIPKILQNNSTKAINTSYQIISKKKLQITPWKTKSDNRMTVA